MEFLLTIYDISLANLFIATYKMFVYVGFEPNLCKNILNAKVLFSFDLIEKITYR